MVLGSLWDGERLLIADRVIDFQERRGWSLKALPDYEAMTIETLNKNKRNRKIRELVNKVKPLLYNQENVDRIGNVSN